ncbi:hypothetical protein NKH72_13075 [Mesorhizobium sp. M0955]|uniref:hypothetical protein n=1 Tax=Mesorhizobium sp. M0955 TaxID=2957033 RepID=UPI0033371338
MLFMHAIDETVYVEDRIVIMLHHPRRITPRTGYIAATAAACGSMVAYLKHQPIRVCWVNHYQSMGSIVEPTG